MVDQADGVFAGSIPDIYDEYLVPLIFEQYAEDLAARTRALNPKSVLEVAAGSGVVPRAVAPVLEPGAEYVVTDLNVAMLERARSAQPDPSNITWRVADALDLPFEDNSFDLVLCQFGAMFYPDRVQGYREARRVLNGGGAFIFNMWDRIEENEFADEVTRSLAELYPDDPPQFLARTPHGHHETEVYRTELLNAGFGGVQVEAVDALSVAEDPKVPAIAYCTGTPLRSEIEARGGASLDEATAHGAEAIRTRFGEGPVKGRIRGYVITAT